MIFNLAFFILTAIFIAKCFDKIKIPSLLGMLFTGILLGKYSKEYFVYKKGLTFLNTFFISDKILEISPELRTFALIIILIRAGLGIDRDVLKKIGKVAFKMGSIPCLVEGFTVTLITHFLLKIPFPISACLGFILAAVSPAVIVPEMLFLKQKGLGKQKEIPTIILAGSSIDDIFSITLFTVFLEISLGKKVNFITSFLKIPLSIILGLTLGLIIGYLIFIFFKTFHMRDTKKTLIFIFVAIIFHHIEELKIFPVASLLSIMAMGFVILSKDRELAEKLAKKFNSIWVFGEILLFVLIGSAVNIKVIFNSGYVGIIIIMIGLIGRLIGVAISLHNSNLNIKEKLFCGISYTPKATVQAAIAAIPFSMGVPYGDIILAIGVLSIILTVPIGVMGIRSSQFLLLKK